MSEWKKRKLVPVTNAKCGGCALLEKVTLNLSGKNVDFYRCPKNRGLLQYIEPWLVEQCELFKPKTDKRETSQRKSREDGVSP